MSTSAVLRMREAQLCRLWPPRGTGAGGRAAGRPLPVPRHEGHVEPVDLEDAGSAPRRLIGRTDSPRARLYQYARISSVIHAGCRTSPRGPNSRTQGLTSRIGVPSTASRPVTSMRRPATPSTRQTVVPMRFGSVLAALREDAHLRPREVVPRVARARLDLRRVDAVEEVDHLDVREHVEPGDGVGRELCGSSSSDEATASQSSSSVAARDERTAPIGVRVTCVMGSS